MSSRFSLAKPVFFVLLALIIGILYWRGANEQLTLVNTRMKMTDQSAYMNAARKMVVSNYTHVSGRNRMPAYPFIQSLFYDPDMSDEAFFVQGKYVNLVLSMLLLAGIGIILCHYFHWLFALNLILIVTFTFFIFKAGFFQAELLFYFLNFCLFLLMWRMLRNPSWLAAILTGLVAGFAHLTKASILPGLAIFIASMGLDWLLTLFRRDEIDRSSQFVNKSFYYQPILVLLVVLCFLAVLFPYIQTSKQLFGHYFYNVNSTFYLWYDSWEEVKQGTAAHSDRTSWPDMPADEIPTMSKYLRSHTAGQIVDRFKSGAILISSRALNSYGYFKYVVLYTAVLIVAMVKYRERSIQIAQSNIATTVFLILYFSTYFLLYAWFSPMVDGGNRLILAQFLPLMFTLAIGLQHLFAGSHIKVFSYQFNKLTLINLAVLVFLIFDIQMILTESINTMYGGH